MLESSIFVENLCQPRYIQFILSFGITPARSSGNELRYHQPDSPREPNLDNAGNGDKQPGENQVAMGSTDQLAINLLARDRLYEISIRLHRSMWRERRRLDVTVPNSGKLEIYLSNLPGA